MKSLLIIPLFTAAALAIAALVLALSGVRFGPADPLAGAIVGGVAGAVAMIPIIWLRPRDQASAFPLALGGTVLHLLVALAIGVVFIARGAEPERNRLCLWLIGGYWVSLFVTVGQLRRLILAAPIAKAEK